jgi:hypothetical protein
LNRIVCVTPVGANANDIAYVILRGCNNNIVNGLGFRSMTSSADTGVSGALVLTDDGGAPTSGNAFFGAWFEFLHVPTNGTLINLQGNINAFTDTTYSDVSLDGAATNTAYWTLNNVAHGANSGGNIIRGMIPGRQTGCPQTGVVVNQSYNRIEGVKGYDGYNVTLNAGATYTYAALGGSLSGASVVAFTDNSGNATNTLIDNYLQTMQLHDYKQEVKSVAAQSGPRFSDTLTPANGSVYIGTSGVRSVAVGGTNYHDGDSHVFRDTTGTITYADITPTRGLRVYSGMQTPVRIVTASTSATSADSFIVANGTNIAVTLMAAGTGAGTMITVKNINSTPCTVNALAGQNIDGGTNTETLAQWAVSRYVSTGTAWVKV